MSSNWPNQKSKNKKQEIVFWVKATGCVKTPKKEPDEPRKVGAWESG